MSVVSSKYWLIPQGNDDGQGVEVGEKLLTDIQDITCSLVLIIQSR